MARLAKASGIASILVDRPINVYTGGKTEGPHYNTQADHIVLGKAHHLPWDEVDTFGLIVHECGHVVFPAAYPAKSSRLANLIDDCRQERQMSAHKPHLENALIALSMNVIANRKYDEVDKNGNLVNDPWLAENFDPSLWALMFFRCNLSQDVHDAANAALRIWAKDQGLLGDAEWEDKFRILVKSGLAITRLKAVTETTLGLWCVLYREVFPVPEGSKNENDNPLSGDSDGTQGDASENSSGEGNSASDNDRAEKTSGEMVPDDGAGHQEEGADAGDDAGDDAGAGDPVDNGDADQAPEAKRDDAMQDALDRLREAARNEGENARQAASKENADEIDGISDDDGDDDGDDGKLPGVSVGNTNVEPTKLPPGSIDKNFVNRFVRSIRKMRSVAKADKRSARRTGKLNVARLIRADAKGTPCMRPFDRDVMHIENVPISCIVATDNSGSTGNIIDRLNTFTHNMLYTLRKAGCESAGVVWNTTARTVVGFKDRVSAVSWNRFEDTGGTNLSVCADEIIKTAKTAIGQRKVAFIFTDGHVCESEVPTISDKMNKAGFDAVLLISLEARVPRSGIVDTVVARTLEEVSEKFEKWVKSEYIKSNNMKRAHNV